MKYKAVVTYEGEGFMYGGVKKHESCWFGEKSWATNWAEAVIDTNVTFKKRSPNQFIVEIKIKE
jgi:hypothetical protein